MINHPTYSIDYLTITVTDEDLAARIGPKHTGTEEILWLPTKGAFGYDQGWQDIQTGVKRYRSSIRPDMGVCFVASGNAINRIAQLADTRHVVKALDDYGFSYGRASRIDLALDYYDAGITAYQIAEQLSLAKIETDARKANVVRGMIRSKNGVEDDGITVYLGARQSPRFVRVYDKNAESNGATPSTRFELEAKNDYAKKIWKSISGHRSPDVVKQAVQGAIGSFVTDWNLPDVNALFASNAQWEPAPRDDPQADIKAWLSRQVIPTLVRDYRDTPDGANLLAWLNDAVSNRLHDDEI